MRLRADLDSILASPGPLAQLDPWLWQSLADAVNSKRHAWNSGAFSSLDINAEGRVGPRTRTVILRRVDRDRLAVDFYTDVRSAKVHQMQLDDGHAEVCWMFYRPSTRIQLRLEGTALLLGEEDAETLWQSMPLRSRAAYASIEPPGLVLPSSQPHDTSDRELTEAESERGRENFRVVRTTVRCADLLYLHPEGHIRACVDYASDGASVAKWVVP